METMLGVKNHSNVVTTDFMAQLGVVRLVSGTGVLNIYRKSCYSNPQASVSDRLDLAISVFECLSA